MLTSERDSFICMIDDANGEVLERTTIPTINGAFEEYFARHEPMLVALETGTHSPWASRVVKNAGHEVIVANARQVPLMYGSKPKRSGADGEGHRRGRPLPRSAGASDRAVGGREDAGAGVESHPTDAAAAAGFARAAPALRVSLHAHQRFVDEPDRTLVRHPHPPSCAPWQLQQRQGSHRRHRSLHPGVERPRHLPN